MGKKLFLLIIVAVAVVASAMGQSVVDFAFPRKVSAEALTQLDKALKSGDGNAVVDAMIRYSIAQSSISKQSIDTIVPRIEQLAVKEKRADIKALLYHLEARVLGQYYAKYGAQSQVVDTLPERFELWSKSQIKDKINELMRLSVKDEKALLAKPLSKYAGLISEDPQGIFPSLYHFLALEGYKFTRDDEILTSLLANCEPGSEVHMEVIRNSLSSPVHLAATGATSRYAVAISYLEKYIDKESAGALLRDIDLSDKAISLCEEYVSRFPDGRFASIAKNKISMAREKDVSIFIKPEYATHDSIEVKFFCKNIDTLSLALYRLNDDVMVWDKIVYDRDVDFTLVGQQEIVNASIKLDGDLRTISFPPQSCGRYRVLASYKNDYGELVENGKKISLSNTFIVSDLMLLGFNHNETGNIDLLAVDMTTGAPVEGAKVSNSTWSAITDSDGLAVNTRNKWRYSNEYYVTKDDDKWGRSFYMLSNIDRTDKEILGKIYTDLSIFRPAEKVNFAGVVYSIEADSRKLLSGEKVRFELNDPNDELVDSVSLTTDSWGRATGSFVLPKDKMNGTYSIKMFIENDFIVSKSIIMSEYKIPTFTVSLDSPHRYYNLGEDVEIAGTVMTYSGMPVAGASVHIEMESPIWHDEDEVAMPDTIITTDVNGRFLLVVPAELIKRDIKDEYDEDDDYEYGVSVGYDYTVEVINDQGETCSDEGEIEIVIDEDPSSVKAFDTKILLDGSKTAVPVTVHNADKDTTIHIRYKIKEKTTGKVIKQGDVMNENEEVDWNSLPSGLYEFEAWADNDTIHSNSKLLLYRLTDKKCYLENEPLWLVPGGDKVTKKGKGEVLIGTSVDESHIYYIASTRTRIISRGWLHYKPGIHKFTIDMPKDAGESVTVNFYNIYKKQESNETAYLQAVVPPSQLNIKIESFRDRLVPGENEQWKFTLLDNTDKKQQGALMLAMVDKAIYELSSNRWNASFQSWSRDLYDYESQYISDYFGIGYSGPSWHKPLLNEFHFELPELNTYHRKWFLVSQNNEGGISMNDTKVVSIDSTGCKVTGYVYSVLDYEPVIGATVMDEENPKNGVATDFDGKFTLTVSSLSSEIIVRYIGYVDHKFKPSELPQVILLEEDESQILQEVVVTGYGTQDAGDEAKLLEGRAAGVSAQKMIELNIVADEAVLDDDSSPKIRVRGTTSVYSSKPLWVVDGVIIEDNVELDADALSSGDVKTLIASSLKGLSADDVESFNILRGNSATSIYGARAMAGVIVVNTKSKQFARNKMMGTVKAREPGLKTALWKPMLVTGDDGRVAVEFTAPENNSTWVVQAIAYNENLISGVHMKK